MALALAAAACGAPASERATGAVAADMDRALATGSGSFENGLWGSILAGGVRGGLVDYAYVATREADLSAYLSAVASVDLGSLAPPELEALLINAYNALTVRAILDHPNVSSIREIDGVWTKLEWTVGGHSLTLDGIEHTLLRPFFRDPRIHFVVNCASRSCAPLPPWACAGAELDAQLEGQARAFLTDRANVRVDGGSLVVSRYFDWYGDDFVREGWEPRAATIAGFIARYATPDVTAAIEADPAIRVTFEDYDWSLNAATRPPATGEASGGEDGGFFARFQAWVGGFGPLAPLVYGLGYVLFVVLLVPGGALTIGAGVTFGLGLGMLVVVAGANVGAALAFLIARYLLRGRVERWLEGRERLRAVDRAVETQGWRVVALTRLSPVFPFNVQNYFYGLTGVSFRGYVGASLIGMLPGTLLYTYIGAAGAGVARAAGGAATWGETVLLVAGLAATLAVVAIITRVAKRELARATGEGGGATPHGAPAA